VIKRPLNERFRNAVLQGEKTTTIRDKPWPVGVPIMLYSWEGLAYRSKQIDLCPVKVVGFWRIRITHHTDGAMGVECGRETNKPLWQTEGFADPEEMDAWFKPLVKPGQTVEKWLMNFQTIEPQ